MTDFFLSVMFFAQQKIFLDRIFLMSEALSRNYLSGSEQVINQFVYNFSSLFIFPGVFISPGSLKKTKDKAQAYLILNNI